MKLIGAVLLHNDNHIIDEYFNLGFVGYFSRNSIKELLIFFCKEISNTIQDDITFTVVFEEKTNSYGCFKKFREYTYCIIYDNEYPVQVIKKIIFLFREQKLKAKYILENYNDPNNLDDLKKIKDIQQKLNDTRLVLHNTIEEVLSRGEKLDDIVQKSNDLSQASKDFYGRSKKLNSCCGVF
jgi:synaptobrevin family protein YKT6